MMKIIEAKFGQLLNFDYKPHYDEFAKKYPDFELHKYFKTKEELTRWKSILPMTQKLRAFEVKSVGSYDEVLIHQQLLVKDSIEENPFMYFVRHLLYQSEEGSLEYYLKNTLKIRSFSFEEYNDYHDVRLMNATFKMNSEIISSQKNLKEIIAAYFHYINFLLEQSEADMRHQ